MPKSRYKNTSLANLEYRLRKYKDILHEELFDIIKQKEDVIINYIQQQQLYRRGITGDGKKIWEKHPYSPRTIANKKKKAVKRRSKAKTALKKPKTAPCIHC